MVSPMREKRVWPAQDKDSDGETVAAFEAAVAVVKETVVRSGEVLVSAKEDLSDHQRWLKAQTTRVEADRERHDRWLQRQRERQEALERREQKRARRRARRRAVAQSISHALSSSIFAVRSVIWLVAAKTMAGLNSIDAAAASGLRWLGAKVRVVALYVTSAVQQGLRFAGRNVRVLALSVGAMGAAVAAKTMAGLNSIDAAAASDLRWLGAKVRVVALYVTSAVQQGLRFAGRNVRVLALSVGAMGAAVAAKIGAKTHEVAPSVGNFLSLCFGGPAARAHDISRSAGGGLRVYLSGLSAKTGALAQSAGEALGPAVASIAAKAHELAPSLTKRIAQAGQTAGHYARTGAVHVQSLLARDKAIRTEALTAEAPAVGSENALSLPPRVGRFDLSQMLIIAGAMLLVCGGLMLGGGLMLRAKTPGSLSLEAASAEPIAWLFEHPSLPIDERSMFVLNTTPDGIRIKGFAIGGVNLSDQTLGSLGGVIKPDGQDHDLKLGLSVENPETDPNETNSAEAQPVAVQPEGAVPSQAPFKLIFLFPDEANGGMTPQQVLSSFGGLLLKVHYQMDGKQRSLIQYLPASLLEAQFAEIVKGS